MGSPGAQVSGQRDPGVAFFTRDIQFGTPAMAPDVVEFIHKIMYFLGSHGGKGFTDLICSENVTSSNKVRGSTDKVRGSTE